MSMTRKERKLKEYIKRYLKTQGYKTYAHLLEDFDLNLTNNPEVIAFMEPGKGRIVISAGLDEKQISTTIRHEILHQYLKHEKRLLDHLAKRHKELEGLDDVPIDQLKDELYSSSLFNYAADYEISNRGYTKKDKENIRSILLNGKIVRGLVTEDDHPDWVDLSVEEMYDKLRAEMEEEKEKLRQMQDAEDVVVIGISQDEMTFNSFSGTIYDGTLYVDDKKKKEANNE